MSHVAHPPIHEAGLADGCPDCVEIAEKPAARLDERALRDLIDRTLRNRFGGPESAFGSSVAARTETEAIAMASVLTTLERVGRLASIAPDHLGVYLRERWHVEALA